MARGVETASGRLQLTPTQLEQKSSNAPVPDSPLPSVVPGGESDVERAGGGDVTEAELAFARFSSPAAQWEKISSGEQCMKVRNSLQAERLPAAV